MIKLFANRAAGLLQRGVVLALLGVLAAAEGVAQGTVFPLSVIQVPPTNVARLSDLTAAGTSPWSVTIQSLDLAESSIQAALRVRIEGQGVLVATRAPLLAPLITLTPGQPLTLTSADLAGYLTPGNLITQGFGPDPITGDLELPAGGYSICVEAVPLGRPTGSAAGESCVAVLSASYVPAVLTYPLADEEVLPVDPQNLVFAWQTPWPRTTWGQLRAGGVGRQRRTGQHLVHRRCYSTSRHPATCRIHFEWSHLRVASARSAIRNRA